MLWVVWDTSQTCADANFGAWPDGEPITAEASIHNRPRVFVIDADLYEPAEGSDEWCIRTAEDDGARFEQHPGGWVASRAPKSVGSVHP